MGIRGTAESPNVLKPVESFFFSRKMDRRDTAGAVRSNRRTIVGQCRSTSSDFFKFLFPPHLPTGSQLRPNRRRLKRPWACCFSRGPVDGSYPLAGGYLRPPCGADLECLNGNSM